MKIYIASSWRHEHGVTMLTDLLRKEGHEVISWIENNYGEGYGAEKSMPFEEWMKTDSADKSFQFDTNGAMTSELIIYYGNGGKDAAAEVGMAYASGLPIIGLYQKGEDFGLMRKMMVSWVSSIDALFAAIYDIRRTICNPYACFGRKPHPMDFEDKDEFQKRIEDYNKWEEIDKKNRTQ